MTFNVALSPRLFLALKGQPCAIQPCCAYTDHNVAALSGLILHLRTSPNPVVLVVFQLSRALPLERGRLLDLLCGRLRPPIPEHFQVSVRITSGAVLFLTLLSQQNALISAPADGIGNESSIAGQNRQ